MSYSHYPKCALINSFSVLKVVVQIVSSDNECSEQVFIEKDGSYLSSNKEEEARLEEQEVRNKRKRENERKDRSEEWEPCLEDVDSDVSMD